MPVQVDQQLLEAGPEPVGTEGQADGWQNSHHARITDRTPSAAEPLADLVLVYQLADPNIMR